jgi:hypothetical protein
LEDVKYTHLDIHNLRKTFWYSNEKKRKESKIELCAEHLSFYVADFLTMISIAEDNSMVYRLTDYLEVKVNY